MSRSVEVAVSRSCIGSGNCRRLMPAVFGADENFQSVVRTSPVTEDDALREVLESCPVEAISARDAATGEQLFP